MRWEAAGVLSQDDITCLLFKIIAGRKESRKVEKRKNERTDFKKANEETGRTIRATSII